MAGQILAGIRVLELGQLIAGPFAAKTLADFGAQVVKIEPPGQGDPLRKWRLLHEGTSVWWEAQSRNKQSVCVDLRQPEGQDIVRLLAREADVLIENFRPGTLEKWGLSWDALHALNPRLIMLRVSGYGQTGPKAREPGFAAIGEAMAGLRYLNGEPGRAPVRAGLSLGDTIAGLHGALGVLLVLYQRDARGGQGRSSTRRCTRACSTSAKACCRNTRSLARCANRPAPRCPASPRPTPIPAGTAMCSSPVTATPSMSA